MCKIKHNKLPVNKNTLCIAEQFNSTILKSGFSTKYKFIFLKIFSKINFFLYQNKSFIYLNYLDINWMFDNIFEKKLNCQIVFNDLTNLLKPPFIIKSLQVSKKLKKKLKIKYTIKILYKKDDKRIKNALKQIYYNSNNQYNNKFQIRLYKSILFSFLD